MSSFDPEAFLDITLTEPTVKRPPIPVGDYHGILGEIKSRAWQGKKDPSKSGIAWDVPIEIELPPSVATMVGQPTIKVTDSIMLDITDSGSLDNSPGKNRRLRLYREALDMNKPGDSFSARAMSGRPVLVKIKHEEYEGDLYERVDAVARA
jgi:hypothetical protein